MKRIHLFFVLFLTAQFNSLSQDTTWVQTFTFDSITARRGNFIFPAELNEKRFEKVLMYYKLKCSPLTTWDQYNCGEWDYLTYTRVFDHTGAFDSIRIDGSRYLANLTNPSTINYTPAPFTYKDTYVRNERNRSNAVLTDHAVTDGSSIGNYAFPFNVASNGGRYQMILTATELASAGIVAGDIQSLKLFVNELLVNGELHSPVISLKSTTETTLTAFHESGFTAVYEASRWSLGSQPELALGENEFLFYQPFTWNGSDNIIVEFSFENTFESLNSLSFEAQSDASSNSLVYDALNGQMNFNGSSHALLELSDFDLGDEMTITFWAKGTGSAGTNTSILEAFDTLNNRVINIHMPWSDNVLYFDAGQGTGYDRINKAMTGAEIDNNWNHWAFVKKQSTGEMFVYKNGVLWHSGTNKNLSIGHIHRFVLGSNWNQAYMWKGKIDEFQLYDVALPQATIQSYMAQQPDATHPNWSDLLVYYDFDDQSWAKDRSQNNYLLMPSQEGMIGFDEYPKAGVKAENRRPKLSLGQGIVNGTMTTTQHPKEVLKEATVIFEQAPVDRHFGIVNAYVGVLEGNETVYADNGSIVSQVPFAGSDNLTNSEITYYKEPYEIVHDVEIARYITPYGIQFDLGPQGFSWIYDVTDYQQYLKDTVDLAAHNTQELLDLRFAFIEGIPPRDVHNRQPIWADFRSYQYAAMDNNTVLQEVPIELSDTSEMFKIKTRFTGHGHYGSVNCCEWDSKDHKISLNGVERFNWEIWEETACGDNPNISQGGTWPYAREGWCPGDMVREYDHELTPFVNPGETVLIDYDIEDVPTNDQDQGNGNYVVAMDLISYSAPNFQHDAAIVDILNPNNYEYYRKWNPTCSNPRIILQNTGEQPLTYCKIRCWISYGDWLEYEWTGNLNFLEKEIVEIPVEDLAWWNDYEGAHTFTAQVYDVQGWPSQDEYANNNAKTAKFIAPETINGPFFVWFTTNNKANENKYRLEDASGNVIFERNTLLNNTQYKDTFDLAPGCYSIILEDSDHDGIAFWASNQFEGETAGQFRLRQVGGSYIEFFPGDFGRYHRYNFSVGFTVNTEEKELDHKIAILPNPTNGECTIELSGFVNNKAELYVLDLSGRVIHQEKMNATVDFAESHLNLGSFPAGNYIVKIITGDSVYTEKLVKQ